jgi:succinate dehydrogenase / fumarate reductase cytochrome b subunit
MRPLDRTKFLALFQRSCSPDAIASLAHHATAVLLAAAMPVGAYAFTRSVAGPEGFAEVARWGGATPARFAFAVVVLGLAYHLLAGVHHALMEAGISPSLRSGQRSTWAIVGVGAAALLVAAMGLPG